MEREPQTVLNLRDCSLGIGLRVLTVSNLHGQQLLLSSCPHGGQEAVCHSVAAAGQLYSRLPSHPYLAVFIICAAVVPGWPWAERSPCTDRRNARCLHAKFPSAALTAIQPSIGITHHQQTCFTSVSTCKLLLGFVEVFVESLLLIWPRRLSMANCVGLERLLQGNCHTEHHKGHDLLVAGDIGGR